MRKLRGGGGGVMYVEPPGEKGEGEGCWVCGREGGERRGLG